MRAWLIVVSVSAVLGVALSRSAALATVHLVITIGAVIAVGSLSKRPDLILAVTVYGGLSDVLSEDGARDFLALCPHSEYVNVTDAAHMVAGDRNDVFGTAVVDFLGHVAPPDPRAA